MPTLVDPGTSVAIIGAGISGLAAAGAIQRSGASVTVFDKGRRVAGRMSTRQADGGLAFDLAFDHGAQYFTVRDRRFDSQVASWVEQGAAGEWQGRIGVLRDGQFTLNAGDQQRFVGVPSMSRPCLQLAEGLDVKSSIAVAVVQRTGQTWRLVSQEGDLLGDFDCVIVATPAPQAAQLLRDAPKLQTTASATRMSACWAAMLAFDKPLELEFDGAFVENSPLSWIARDSSKPGRSKAWETWVLHASPEWSQAHLEEDAELVLEKLSEAFRGSTRIATLSTRFSRAHRWRYALPPEPLDEPYLLDHEMRIAACGDWCGGPRVEGVYLSGVRLADRLLQSS